MSSNAGPAGAALASRRSRTWTRCTARWPRRASSSRASTSGKPNVTRLPPSAPRISSRPKATRCRTASRSAARPSSRTGSKPRGSTASRTRSSSPTARSPGPATRGSSRPNCWATSSRARPSRPLPPSRTNFLPTGRRRPSPRRPTTPRWRPPGRSSKRSTRPCADGTGMRRKRRSDRPRACCRNPKARRCAKPSRPRSPSAGATRPNSTPSSPRRPRRISMTRKR